MNSDPLANLLHAADAVAPRSQSTPAEILHGVERRRRKRTRRRTALATSSALLAALAVWWASDAPGPVQQIPLAADRPAINATPSLDPNWRLEIARLEHEAQQARALAKALQLAHAATDAQAAVAALPPAPLSPRAAAAEQVDAAARTSVLRADMLRESFARLDEAAAAYRAVIERFPETHWATVAQRRLADMGRMN